MTAEDRPLWVRMREAADTLDEAAEADPWAVRIDTTPIRAYAAAQEQIAAAQGEREQLINDVAATIYAVSAWSGCAGSAWERLAAEDGERVQFLKIARQLLTSFDIRQQEAPF